MHVSHKRFLLGLFTASLVMLAQAQPQDPSSSGDMRIERIPAPGTAIAQDAQGFMWFGGKSGLYKYDGYTLTHYRPDPADATSLSHVLVECLYVDRDGTLWVGTTGGGLDRFDPATETFTHYRHDPNDATSLSDDVVTAMLEDSQGTLWVGTGGLGLIGSGGGLNRFDRETGTFTRYLHDPDDSRSLSDNQVRVIYEDRAGTLWIGTGDFGNPNPSAGLNSTLR